MRQPNVSCAPLFSPSSPLLPQLLCLAEWCCCGAICRLECMLHKMHAEHPFPPSSPEIASLVRQLVERVGAERLVYGSVRISIKHPHLDRL